MSRVTLIAADKPLPLCDNQVERTKIVTLPDSMDEPELRGKEISVTYPAGFAVREHGYYRPAVDMLGLTMKPYQYELNMEIHEDDLSDFRAYLEQNFASGEEVELWNLWVGVDALGAVPHYRGHLADFDMDTLKQFECPPHQDGGIGQCCMTVAL